MRRLIAPAFLAALLRPVAVSAAESPLAPLAFLAGHCWTTVIDGGTTWTPGNHQVFTRIPSAGGT
jgi:hypothetical protein